MAQIHLPAALFLREELPERFLERRWGVADDEVAGVRNDDTARSRRKHRDELIADGVIHHALSGHDEQRLAGDARDALPEEVLLTLDALRRPLGTEAGVLLPGPGSVGQLLDAEFQAAPELLDRPDGIELVDVLDEVLVVSNDVAERLAEAVDPLRPEPLHLGR